MVAHEYIDVGMPINTVLRVVELAKSTFYYKPRCGNRGRAATTHTMHSNGYWIPNEQIIVAIIWLLSLDFVDYGYVKVTRWLRRLGLLINKKKVLRLMRAHRLLLPKPKRISSGKTWVKELLPSTELPFDYLEFDIKFIRINGAGRNAMLLTVIDVLSRFNMGQLLQYTMKKEDVVMLFKDIFARYAFPNRITVRSDNGSQFESNLVRDLFKEVHVIQEFTKPATPEQNAHIESYHSIVQRSICDRMYIDDLEVGQVLFARFRDFYNFERLHSGVAYQTPAEELKRFNVTVPKPDFPPVVIPAFFNSH